jgi:hypothetical protein
MQEDKKIIAQFKAAAKKNGHSIKEAQQLAGVHRNCIYMKDGLSVEGAKKIMSYINGGRTSSQSKVTVKKNVNVSAAIELLMTCSIRELNEAGVYDEAVALIGKIKPIYGSKSSNDLSVVTQFMNN